MEIYTINFIYIYINKIHFIQLRYTIQILEAFSITYTFVSYSFSKISKILFPFVIEKKKSQTNLSSHKKKSLTSMWLMLLSD